MKRTFELDRQTMGEKKSNGRFYSEREKKAQKGNVSNTQAPEYLQLHRGPKDEQKKRRLIKFMHSIKMKLKEK